MGKGRGKLAGNHVHGTAAKDKTTDVETIEHVTVFANVRVIAIAAEFDKLPESGFEIVGSHNLNWPIAILECVM